MESLCVFCGSSPGARADYRRAARRLGRTLAARGIGLVYGGGSVGLMGELADAALAAAGRVVGVIPQALLDKEVGHGGLSELRVVASMHERKALMAELADGFAALPGGLGTLEELFEVWTWGQLGLHPKPIGLLNIGGYFDPLIACLDHMTEEGFVRRSHREMLAVDADPDGLLARLAAYHALPADKWIGRGET